MMRQRAWSLDASGEDKGLRGWIQGVSLWAEAVDYILSRGAEAYLVGGTIRDVLLGRPAYDLDLAIGEGGKKDPRDTVEGALGLAREMADRLGAAYVLRDAERGVARVIRRTQDGQHMIDLAALRGEGLLADLCARDFTVNAMALPLDDLDGAILDPTDGRKDLALRCIRMTSPAAFEDDPLRLIRAVRLAGELGFSIEEETAECIAESAARIERVSAERVCEELFNTLALPRAAACLERARDLGLLRHVLNGGEIDKDGMAQGIAAVDNLEERWIGDPSGTERVSLKALEWAGDALYGYWQECLAARRSRFQLLKLAALLVDIFHLDDRVRRLESLALARREIRHLTAAWQGDAFLREHWDADRPRLSAYRYFRATGEAGVNGALLHLALCPAELQRVAWLAVAWFRRRDELVDVAPLLSGDALMDHLGLQPGPRIGRLIERLCEAQVQRQVTDRCQAKAYLSALVQAE